MIDSTNPRQMANNIKELNARSAGTTVEGNPSGSGFNTLLTKLLIGSKKYKLPNQVIANPEGEASGTLTKVDIGGSIFGVGGGSSTKFKILPITKAYSIDANGSFSFNLLNEITVPSGFEIVGVIGFNTQSVVVTASTVTVENNSYGCILNNLSSESVNNSLIVYVLCVTSGTIES